MRPQLQKFRDAPAALGEACERLPPATLALLAETFLPAGDVTRDDGLRSPALAQALREFKESLDETPTPRALQRRRDQSWTPRPSATPARAAKRRVWGEDGPSR